MTAYLVGAGPGDPGLLTARAIELIASADVILHDRLIPHEALAGARPDAEIVDVGKVGGGEQVPQRETTRLLVEHARAGRSCSGAAARRPRPCARPAATTRSSRA